MWLALPIFHCSRYNTDSGRTTSGRRKEKIARNNWCDQQDTGIIAGVIGKRGYANGDAKSVLFDYPYGICFHPQLQVVFVSDRASALRKVSLVNGKNMS